MPRPQGEDVALPGALACVRPILPAIGAIQLVNEGTEMLGRNPADDGPGPFGRERLAAGEEQRFDDADGRRRHIRFGAAVARFQRGGVRTAQCICRLLTHFNPTFRRATTRSFISSAARRTSPSPLCRPTE